MRARQARAIEAESISEEDFLRAHFYGLLSHLLARPPSKSTLDKLTALEGDETEIGESLGTLSSVARKISAGEAEDEYNALFIGGGTGGELTPFASYYFAGALFDKPLVVLRGDMEKLGIAASDTNNEPEDAMFMLMEMMHGLITGTFGEAASLETQQEFFRVHLEPWAVKFFTDLEGAKAANLYMPVGAMGRIFMDIEAKGFAMLAH